jgi:hypothetical protein
MIDDRTSIRRRAAPTHIRDAIFQAPISREQQRLPLAEDGIPMVRRSSMISVEPAHQDPAYYAVYRLLIFASG